MRASWIDGALTALETNPRVIEAWMVVAEIGKLGLNNAELIRVSEVFKKLDFTALMGLENWPALAQISTSVSLPAGNFAADGTLFGKVHSLAVACAAKFPGPVLLSDVDATDVKGVAAKALSGIFEVVFTGAKAATKLEAIEKLEHLILGLTTGWPASAASARALFDSFVREAIPGESSAIWKAFIWLRGCE